MCKYYAILYKSLERLWISVSMGLLKAIPVDIEGGLYITSLGRGWEMTSSYSTENKKNVKEKDNQI